MPQTCRHDRQTNTRSQQLCRHEMTRPCKRNCSTPAWSNATANRFVTQFGFHDAITSAVENNGQPATATPLAAARFEHCSRCVRNNSTVSASRSTQLAFFVLRSCSTGPPAASINLRTSRTLPCARSISAHDSPRISPRLAHVVAASRTNIINIGSVRRNDSSTLVTTPGSGTT